MPDTRADVAQRYADRIRSGIPRMLQEHQEREREADAKIYMALAERGAQAYLEHLEHLIATGQVDQLDVDQARLVATAVSCAGWLGATIESPTAAVRALVNEGYFEFFPAVPGRWLACYRLVWRD